MKKNNRKEFTEIIIRKPNYIKPVFNNIDMNKKLNGYDLIRAKVLDEMTVAKSSNITENKQKIILDF